MTRSPKARASLGHTESIAVKLHPDLRQHIAERAAEEYCSPSEYVRTLIIADMRNRQRRGDAVG